MNRSIIALSVIGSAAAFAADAPPPHAAVQPLYRTAQTIPLGSPDRWDYLTWDAASHRLFAAHGASITVVDIERGKVVGEIPAPGANGVALAPSAGKGYAGSSEKHAIVVFDLASLQVLKQIPADEDTDGAVYDPASTRVFVMHGDPKEVTAIDTRSDTIAARIPLGGEPEFAAADGVGKLYVNIKDLGTVERIDTRSLRVDAKWPLPGCEKPHGLAVDARSGRLFSGCVNERLLVIDTHDGRLIAQLPIGKGSDAIGFDPKRHRVLSSNGVGTLSVIEQTGADKYLAMTEVPTQPSARTLAVDADTGRVFLVAGERIETDPAASDPRKRFGIRPGTVQVLVERPVARGSPVSESR
jgi:DNA-binding beta-propeller fold protein YncE